MRVNALLGAVCGLLALAPRRSGAQEPACVPLDEIRCFREGEPAELERLGSLVSRRGGTLTIRLRGRTRRFVDDPTGNDGLRLWALRRAAAPDRVVVVDELGYASHTHHLYWLVSGREQELECAPLFAPDKRSVVCLFGVTDEGGTRSSVAIYRADADSLVPVAAFDLREAEPLDPRWNSTDRVTFRLRQMYRPGSASTGRCSLRYSAGAWHLERNCEPRPEPLRSGSG